MYIPAPATHVCKDHIQDAPQNICGYHTHSECTFRHATYVNLCHMCADTTDTLTLATHTCRHFMHTCTPHTCDIPSPPRAEPHHSSPAAQLPPPPRPCSRSAPPHMVLSLTWATVLQEDCQEKVLGEHGAPSQPLLLHPASSQPLQSSQLGSQPGAGLQRAAHPAHFSPGQSACQAGSSPTWSSPWRGRDHKGRESPWSGDGGCGS